MTDSSELSLFTYSLMSSCNCNKSQNFSLELSFLQLKRKLQWYYRALSTGTWLVTISHRSQAWKVKSFRASPNQRKTKQKTWPQHFGNANQHSIWRQFFSDSLFFWSGDDSKNKWNYCTLCGSRSWKCVDNNTRAVPQPSRDEPTQAE